MRGHLILNYIKSFQVNNQKVTIQYEKGNIQATIMRSDIVRVVFDSKTSPTHSYAIENEKTEKTDYKVEKKANTIVITTDLLNIIIYPDKYIDVYNHAGEPLVLDYRGSRKKMVRDLSDQQTQLVVAEGHAIDSLVHSTNSQAVKVLHQNEHFYGLGDKTGFLDKRGYVYDNWNTDDPSPQVESFTRLYKTVPFLVGLNENRPFGLFFDSTFPSHFDLGKESNDYYVYTSSDDMLDYYIIGGSDMSDVIGAYTYLTGRTPLPQKWTLGYQQSRWSYESEEQVNYIANKMRENKLPCDVIHLDIDYMNGFRVFTVNKANFPKFSSLIKRLNLEGYKIVTIIDPGVKRDEDYSVYADGIASDMFVKDAVGKVYQNTVWPGDAVFPDFGREKVRKWWADNIKFLTDQGVCGVWNDMNEPATFNGDIPSDVVFYDELKPATHLQMHNVYGHNMARATYRGLKEQTGARPFVISRAVYSGSQKYTTIWTGDNHSLWVHLQWMIPQLCNLGLSGFGFSGTDIGGFGGDTTPELLSRWIEAAIFSPLLRNHSTIGSRAQEPWSFGEPTLSIYRKYLELRYHLLDYLYDLFAQGSQTGLPIMRPLVLHYADDENTRTINDEYLVGENILVAPIVMPGIKKRLVYLPKGQWYDFWTNHMYIGQQTYVIDAPIEKLPLFVKGGTLLPWRPLTQSVNVTSENTITFKLYGNSGLYEHYQDNGLDFKYENGEYNLYEISVHNSILRVELTHFGYELPYTKITIDKNGSTTDFLWEANNKKYHLSN